MLLFIFLGFKSHLTFSPSRASFLFCTFDLLQPVQVQALTFSALSSSPSNKTLEHCLLCCLSLASLNGLAAVASSPTLHTVCLCDSLLADDLLVGALRRNISSFPGLFSHATAAALIPSRLPPPHPSGAHRRRQLSRSGASRPADCCWISCVLLQGISSPTGGGVLSAHSVHYH